MAEQSDQFRDWADLKAAVDGLESARVSLERAISRGTFPEPKRVMRVDNEIRDIVGRLRTFLRESEGIRARQGEYVG